MLKTDGINSNQVVHMSGRSQSSLVRFVNYARMGENDKLVDMLNSGQDANEANEAGFTALILAAKEGKLIVSIHFWLLIIYKSIIKKTR